MNAKQVAIVLVLALFGGAASARYVQEDPIGLEGGDNRFGYVDGNPLQDLDPLGLANSGWKPSRTMFVPIESKNTCTCSDIMVYQDGIGKDAGGGTEYGHHWIELGSTESYGFWPNKAVTLVQTVLGVPGSVNQGQLHDPHHGTGAAVAFPAKSMILASAKQTCAAICNQAKQCIRSFAASYGQKLGGRWSYRGDIGDNNCHTFQWKALEQCKLRK